MTMRRLRRPHCSKRFDCSMVPFRIARVCCVVFSILGVAVEATYNFTFNGNPWITHTSSADPDAHVWDGTVWVYCSKDANLRLRGLGPDAFNYDHMDGYNVFSSTDLINWVDHGEIFHSRNSPWGPPGWMWAPSAHWNGKYGSEAIYYLYYPHKDLEGIWRMGVATAPTPTGPFTDIGAPIEGVVGIDPRLFVDDDNQAYLYFNSAMVVKLKENLVEIAETPRNIDYGANDQDLYHFEEGSYMHKHNGVYYYSYSNWKAQETTAYYGIGSSPYGPFEWKGALAGRKPGSQDHHSIIEFQGTWYYFFHRDTFAEDKKADNWYGHRRISCYEVMTYNDDGTIQQVGPTAWTVNSGGGPHLASDGTQYNWDEWYADSSSAETSTASISGTSDGVMYQSYRQSIGNSFTYDIPMANGEYLVTLKYAELKHDQAGKRMFAVNMENITKNSNLDIFARVGQNAAYDEAHTVIVQDHVLNIEFVASVDLAMVSAIDIRLVPKPTSAPSRQPTTMPPSTMNPTEAPSPKPNPVPNSSPTLRPSQAGSNVTTLSPSSDASTMSPSEAASSDQPANETETQAPTTNSTAEPTPSPFQPDPSNATNSSTPTSSPAVAPTAQPTASPVARVNATGEVRNAGSSFASPSRLAWIIVACCLGVTLVPLALWQFVVRAKSKPEVGLKQFVDDVVVSFQELDSQRFSKVADDNKSHCTA